MSDIFIKYFKKYNYIINIYSCIVFIIFEKLIYISLNIQYKVFKAY